MPLTIIPLFGGIFGIKLWRSWQISNFLAKAILVLSCGLISFGIGLGIFAYYNLILNVPVPYPSLADLGFLPSYPLWMIGLVYLLGITGIKLQLKKITGKMMLFSLTLLAVVSSHYLFFIVAREGQIDFKADAVKLFLDLVYPISDIIILTLTLFLIYGLSFDPQDSKIKTGVVTILLAFIVNYMADFGFSYSTTVGTYFVGNWADFLFATSMFLLSFGVNSLDHDRNKGDVSLAIHSTLYKTE
ncbi:hypothetical protein A3H40_02650 [Candidatus Daviesbacteria bacterium RIFCSPLOWO2_02_FULL_38_15]|uniref:Uncharacterized protein n=1 Tax=Candidatus Daviesbacteria bacterium RIFCSPLOWO2_02_FULL_38_15 TaxID=1797794 RepID=A0A1F5N565_9BACT|nr:MAG: hypothetical protein A3H40_02650 [Candidatus Daviesbacteria bacterium RIFCSPLOWO2_02_FULL_38_15]